MPVVGLAAEDVGGEGARDRARIAQEEVGEGVAGAGRAGGVLGQRAVVVPLAGVLLAVGEERLPAAVLAAELDDVPALHPGQVVADLPDLQVLRLRPLVERRAVHRGVAAPGEVGERAAHARPLGLLEAADAKRVVRVLALQEGIEVDDRRYVAEADVVQQRGRQVVGHAEDDVLAARAEGGLAERGVRVGIGLTLVVEAVAAEDPRLVVQRLVDPHGDLIAVELSHRRPRERAGRRVGIGDERGEGERLRRQPVGGDDVARERLARDRVVDDPRRGAVVATPHGGARHRVVEHQALPLAHALVAGEEERAAAHDRAAQRRAELLALQLLGLAREEVARIEGVVAHEVEEGAVELVGAGLGGGVERAARLAELGGVGALLHLELLERVDRRLDQRAALVMVGDVGAIEHERGLAAADAADRGARDVVGADAEQVAAARQQDRARRQARQLVEAAPVQRQVHDLGVGDDVTERARLAVEERCAARDDGALGQGAERELDVGAGRLPDLDGDRFHDGGLEAVDGDRDAIDAGIERRDDVVTLIARDDGTGKAGGGVRHDHRRPGYGGLLGVGDGADDAAGTQLGGGRGGREEAEQATEGQNPLETRRNRPQHLSSGGRRAV